ncbi:HalOD1 output domain-containing protein [Halobacterium jilantaiense]|uniref:Halobacterial output domain-containing protein n=1 Tax=Halobacterium jilantaiense TaxID=355548 RepID=A0A1I0MPH1_9EURY|nr:HalOD1 output domain-containing protein [Halobacterium jilantaiense]SEV90407.1 hypothetical protein SAMN04487945_0259 [Halobacterium jilantaiense]
MSPDHDLDEDVPSADTKISSVDRTTFDGAAAAVSRAVATALDCDQTDLEPLQYTIDADALDRLFDGADADDLVVTFSYEEVQVRVSQRAVEVWQ